MKIIHVVVLVVGFLFIRSLHAEELPASVVEACTTNSKIYFTTRLQTNPGMTKGQKRTAILKALGASTSEPNFAVQNLKGNGSTNMNQAMLYTLGIKSEAII